MTDENKYATTWESWVTIPAGAGWAFVVGIISTNEGKRRRLRIAKGKGKAAGMGEIPIAQQAKVNLKPSDWKQLRPVIDQYMEQLEKEEENDN